MTLPSDDLLLMKMAEKVVGMGVAKVVEERRKKELMMVVENKEEEKEDDNEGKSDSCNVMME